MLQLQHIRKVYPGTVALNGVSLQWDQGNIHALIGRNGAGKSTLVNILTGATPPTSGEIRLRGKPVHFRSPADARRAGIAAVFQELSLIPGLSVAENILLGRLPRRTGVLPGRIDWKAAERQARDTLSRLEVSLDLQAPVSTLPVAQQQLVEIAKAMALEPSVLLLDEPTSALSHQEADHVFSLLRTLAGHGVLIVYITHRLQEIQRIADTVTALRDGVSAGTIPAGEASPDRIVSMMFGDHVRFSRLVDSAPTEVPALEVRGLSRGDAFHEICFTLHQGEILGIAGLIGSGRTELLRAIAGADIADAGSVTVGGVTVRPRSPRQMKKLGVVLTPENRKEQGLILQLATRVNVCLASLDRITRHGLITRARERDVAIRTAHDLDISIPDPEMPVSSLSGGNQQKVVLGKWLNTAPRVILFDEPTRGIDIRSKLQMFQTILQLSRDGIASVVVSSELEELPDICHRILVMRNGRLTGTLDPGTITLEELFTRCME